MARNLFCSLCNLSHSAWISAFFLFQFAGALGVITLLRMETAEMVLPLSLLLLGAGLSAMVGANQDISSMSWKRWLPGFIYAAFIFSLSSRSFSDVTMSFSTNWFHPLEYFSLGIILCFVWHPVLENRGFGAFATRVLLTGMVFAMADETLQSFVPGRFPSFLDLGLDLLGLTAGLGVYATIGYIRTICGRSGCA